MLDQIHIIKGYLIHIPSHGGNNHKPKLVLYSNNVSIYEDISIPYTYMGLSSNHIPFLLLQYIHYPIHNLLKYLSEELP